MKLLQLAKSALTTSLLVLLISPNPLSAKDLREVGRETATALGAAIVTAKLVVEQTISSTDGGSRARDKELEIKGTVISPEGLTVVALSSMDPTSLFSSLMPSVLQMDVNFESEVKDLTLVVNKETEIPAEVVLRDTDLDMAIIRPKEVPEEPMTFVDFENSTRPNLLDTCFLLARMGRVGSYEVAVMTGEVQAVVTKPRTFYIPSGELATGGMGLPILSAEGKALGIVLMRVPPGEIGELSREKDGAVAIIQPAEDIVELAAQVESQ
jgi:hypothetical protein